MMDDQRRCGQADERAGLCARCVHVKLIANERGSTFYRCLLADVDPRFARYPRLPVLECPGFVPRSG